MEPRLLGNKIGATRLGFAVLLKFFQHQGSFPSFKNEVAEQVISFVAAQVGIVPEAYLQYARMVVPSKITGRKLGGSLVFENQQL
jgi:hypothetical protein